MSGEVTQILQQMTDGDARAADRLVPLVYDQLRAIAAGAIANERPGHTLQPTALAHEAYLRLAQETQVPWQSRAHFLAIAARCIRQILINHAKSRGAAKRGGDAVRVTLDEHAGADERNESPIDAMDLENALCRLAELHERQAQVVEMRFFGGLTTAETAHVIGVSERTVESDWRFARAWLASQLGDAAGE